MREKSAGAAGNAGGQGSKTQHPGPRTQDLASALNPSRLKTQDSGPAVVMNFLDGGHTIGAPSVSLD